MERMLGSPVLGSPVALDAERRSLRNQYCGR